MEKISLTHWICDNMEKWSIICRIDDRRFSVEEMRKLICETLELSHENKEFAGVFAVLLGQCCLNRIDNTNSAET